MALKLSAYVPAVDHRPVPATPKGRQYGQQKLNAGQSAHLCLLCSPASGRFAVFDVRPASERFANRIGHRGQFSS